ncbi:MAG: hypothetical protein AAF211_23005, partial [Myxococcota bacterium]
MSDPHWSFWLKSAPRPLRDWAEDQPSAMEAWRHCDRGDWLWSALALAAADRRTLVGSMVAAVRRAIEAAHPGRLFRNPSLGRVAAWAAGEPDVGPEADLDDLPIAFRQASNLLLVAATADPVVASATAAELARRLSDTSQDHRDRVLRALSGPVWPLRWPFASAPIHRWPEPAQVAWDLLIERTQTRADLSTLEVLCARSLLPGLTSVPRLKLGVIRERLLLAPELT